MPSCKSAPYGFPRGAESFHLAKPSRKTQSLMKKARELANERERARMHSLNAGFEVLRRTLPKRFSDRKLSKADTLRTAIAYIHRLTNAVEESVMEEKATSPLHSAMDDLSLVPPPVPWASIHSAPASFSYPPATMDPSPHPLLLPPHLSSPLPHLPSSYSLPPIKEEHVESTHFNSFPSFPAHQ